MKYTVTISNTDTGEYREYLFDTSAEATAFCLGATLYGGHLISIGQMWMAKKETEKAQ